MKLLTLTLFAGLMLGLTGGAAMATNTLPTCKPGNSGGYVCTSDGKGYNVSNAASAEAAAAAVATSIANGGAGGQGGAGGNATGGNASQGQGQTSENTNSNTATGGASSATASNGGNTVSIDNRAPKLTTSIGLGVNVNIPIASGIEFNKTIAAAEWLSANGYKSEAYIAVMSSSVGKRIQRNTPEGGEPLCQMTKDGVLQVNKYTDVAACKAYHGVK